MKKTIKKPSHPSNKLAFRTEAVRQLLAEDLEKVVGGGGQYWEKTQQN